MLSIVPTPIGNLGDITRRAAETLAAADFVAAEDTRHTGRLLDHLGTRRPLISFHEHNEASRTTELLAHLKAGKQIALVSDAGCPGISDPGYRLINACIAEEIPITVLPGPSAVITALVGSGFPSDRFFFGGFLPPKSGRRERELQGAASRKETSIFFESPHRLVKTLTQAGPILESRLMCVARELSKTFEEYRRGTATELASHYTAHPPKGEITLLVSGLSAREAREADLHPMDDEDSE